MNTCPIHTVTVALLISNVENTVTKCGFQFKLYPSYVLLRLIPALDQLINAKPNNSPLWWVRSSSSRRCKCGPHKQHPSNRLRVHQIDHDHQDITMVERTWQTSNGDEQFQQQSCLCSNWWQPTTQTHRYKTTTLVRNASTTMQNHQHVHKCWH